MEYCLIPTMVMKEPLRNILLVDDDKDDQVLFKDALRTIAPVVICDVANNGKEALELLATRRNLPDLTFLDLNMPMMNGFEFLSQVIRSDRLKSMHIGIMSTSTKMGDMKTTKGLGARFYMTKPRDFATLCKHISKVLNGEYSQTEFLIAI
jgi:CheY-like chemotaxis protein